MNVAVYSSASPVPASFLFQPFLFSGVTILLLRRKHLPLPQEVAAIAEYTLGCSPLVQSVLSSRGEQHAGYMVREHGISLYVKGGMSDDMFTLFMSEQRETMGELAQVCSAYRHMARTLRRDKAMRIATSMGESHVNAVDYIETDVIAHNSCVIHKYFD